jgi:hypothetical protein
MPEVIMQVKYLGVCFHDGNAIFVVFKSVNSSPLIQIERKLQFSSDLRKN